MPLDCPFLDVIEEEKLIKNAEKIGNILIDGLLKLKKKYSLIGDVRGKGLFLGIELVKNRDTLEPAIYEAKEIVREMLKNNFLLSIDGPLKNVIKN